MALKQQYLCGLIKLQGVPSAEVLPYADFWLCTGSANNWKCTPLLGGAYARHVNRPGEFAVTREIAVAAAPKQSSEEFKHRVVLRVLEAIF